MDHPNCQSCGSTLPFNGFDRRLAVVHCSHCGDLSDPSEAQDTAAIDDPDAQTTENLHTSEISDNDTKHSETSRPIIAMPPGFSSSGCDKKFEIQWSWRSPWAYIFLGMAIFWHLFLFTMFSSRGFEFANIIFVPAGFFLLYKGLAEMFNTTTISADEYWLTVRHSPIPWYPAPTVSSSTIAQLYVSEGFTKSRGGGKTPYYLLYAVLRDDLHQQLSNRLRTIEPALYLEQEFERALHIQDRAVEGEVHEPTPDV